MKIFLHISDGSAIIAPTLQQRGMRFESNERNKWKIYYSNICMCDANRFSAFFPIKLYKYNIIQILFFPCFSCGVSGIACCGSGLWCKV